ncbi:MAG: hypothetical protein N2171_05210 [Clostridia bacterium]|nr:hypothetical protein [Clostridia bacterium]
MNKLIEQIIAIEDMAQEVMNEARTRQAALDETIRQIVDEKQKNIEDKVQAKEQKIRQLEQDIADEKIESAKINFERELKNMEEKYNQNKNIWVEQIFNNIINN